MARLDTREGVLEFGQRCLQWVPAIQQGYKPKDLNALRAMRDLNASLTKRITLFGLGDFNSSAPLAKFKRRDKLVQLMAEMFRVIQIVSGKSIPEAKRDAMMKQVFARSDNAVAAFDTLRNALKPFLPTGPLARMLVVEAPLPQSPVLASPRPFKPSPTPRVIEPEEACMELVKYYLGVVNGIRQQFPDDDVFQKGTEVISRALMALSRRDPNAAIALTLGQASVAFATVYKEALPLIENATLSPLSEVQAALKQAQAQPSNSQALRDALKPLLLALAELSHPAPRP